MQGGAVQGIGWALNEELYLRRSRAGCRKSRASSTTACRSPPTYPMIETVVVEVPNPNHPFGVKGVGEVNICPTMAAVANAVTNAVGRRMDSLPISPPKLLEALDQREGTEL